jgi:hypothetical protein
MGSYSVNIPPGPGPGGGITFTTYIPAPPLLPPPPIPQVEVVCSDSLIRTIDDRWKITPQGVRKRFVYTAAQADKVANQELNKLNGLKDSRTIVVSLDAQLGMGQLIELDEDSGGNYLGRVVGVEFNASGKVVTKSLQLARVYATVGM